MLYVLYAVLLYLVLLSAWILYWLLHDTAPKMLAHDQNKLRGTGVTFTETQDEGPYTICHSIEDGIERIVYTPKIRQHTTPIFMAHGMWHGAWCWQPWQALLAEKGWESIAYSLPGHGKSPTQRSLTTCTLGYYLAFLRAEIQRLPVKPVLMGHSMGGALSQWVLRYVTDELPAVVLVAPWVAHSAMFDDMPKLWEMMKGDPLGMAMMFYQFNADAWVRTPQAAATKLLSQEAVVTPEELQRQLVGESALVLFQHNPPFWKPAENVKTPMLLLAGEQDAVLSVAALQKTAAHYRADFVSVPGAGHNLMMEKSYRETAFAIENWLANKHIP
jgi:pimeloyl-ACP methyl ester carboxylesterase